MVNTQASDIQKACYPYNGPNRSGVITRDQYGFVLIGFLGGNQYRPYIESDGTITAKSDLDWTCGNYEMHTVNRSCVKVGFATLTECSGLRRKKIVQYGSDINNFYIENHKCCKRNFITKTCSIPICPAKSPNQF